MKQETQQQAGKKGGRFIAKYTPNEDDLPYKFAQISVRWGPDDEHEIVLDLEESVRGEKARLFLEVLRDAGFAAEANRGASYDLDQFAKQEAAKLAGEYQESRTAETTARKMVDARRMAGYEGQRKAEQEWDAEHGAALKEAKMMTYRFINRAQAAAKVEAETHKLEIGTFEQKEPRYWKKAFRKARCATCDFEESGVGRTNEHLRLLHRSYLTTRIRVRAALQYGKEQA